MELTVLGSSGSAPQVGNPGSGYLVRSGSSLVWMDCGPGTFGKLIATCDPAALDAVLISHMHIDHCTDIFALFQWWSRLSADTERLPVVVPPGGRSRIQAFLGVGDDHRTFRQFDIRTMEGGGSATFGEVSVSWFEVNHGVPAFGFRLTDGRVSLGYTGDTGPHESLATELSGVDTVLAEASLLDGSERYPFHLSARQAGQLAADAGAGSLIVTHVPRGVDTELSLVQAASEYGGRVVLARPGSVHVIDGGD